MIHIKTGPNLVAAFRPDLHLRGPQETRRSASALVAVASAPGRSVININGVRCYPWRDAYREGEVVESFVAKTRDKLAVLKFLGKSVKRHGRSLVQVTDTLRSYGAAMKDIGNAD
ncbi:DDE-type integrase/transposase/recombinase [Ruegeria aquimaris]|nr:DDE-type integrase/transposase/recombinase [Ruegeria sp. XHP0148]